MKEANIRDEPVYIVSFPRRFSPATRFIPLVVTAMLAGCGQQSPQELWQEAQTAIATGDYRAASIHLKNLVQQDAGHVDALVLLADIALANGDPRSAELQYRRAATRGATDDQVRVGLLESLMELQRYQEVLDEVASIDAAVLAERPAILKRASEPTGGGPRSPGSL